MHHGSGAGVPQDCFLQNLLVLLLEAAASVLVHVNRTVLSTWRLIIVLLVEEQQLIHIVSLGRIHIQNGVLLA